ncbi:unnamed protein product [Parnassius mnemosyne]|uniref:Uncharacterized protein n=1 Tax=Parnassius mnemosyne TaxID=213953 RepID=A0AAV1M6F2_9NEOP
MKLSCALVLTLTNFVIATPFSFSAKGSGASAKAGAVTAPFGTFGVVQPVASNAGYTGSFSKSSSLSSASGGTALSPGSFSYNSAQDNRAPWPGYGTSFTTQAQAVGQNVLTFPQVNKNSITSFSDTSVVATTGANGQTEITGSYPSENSNDLNVNNSGASRLQYQRPSETQEKIPSSTLSSLTSETHESSKPNTPDFPSILKVPGQSDNFKETSKVQNVSSQIVTSGSAYLTSFPNAAVGNIVPQTTVASSENYQIGEQKPNYNGGFGGPPGILKPFDKGSNFKNSDSVNAFLTHKPNVQLSSPVTTKPQGFNNSPENTIKLSYVYTNKGSTDTIKPTDQPLSSGSSNFNAGTSYKPERNPTQTSQIKPTLANNVGKPSSVLKPNEDQLYTLQHFDEITQTSDGTLTQSFEDSSKPQFSSQIPSKFNKPTIDTFSQSKLINGVQVSVQAYPSNDPNSSSDYNVNYENTNVGNESSEKLLNKPTKQSLYASGFGAPTAVVEPVKSEVNNTSKPYLGFTVTSQKETTNTGGSSNILSASQQPSVVSTNYYTTPTPYISSISTTDKSDYVTTTVQSETNQPSNNSSQSSSFNLTYQKNPSLFNVASSGVQSSTLSSNSYPVKPQSQYPEKQVSELGSQKKPFFSNSFGTFVTPKPTSYSGSTAYTSFSSLGYGHSGVSGSLDKSKPTSQFTFTNQYKPSFTNSFGGQSGVLKPSNQLTQTSSTFISSNQPTNYKPVVTPSPLNTAKANEEISVTNEKNSSIVNDYETVSSLSQQSSDTASTQPSIVSTNYYTSPAPSISSESPIFGSNVEQHKYASGSAISNTSETDKKNNVTATVQTETNQPSKKPSQSSSFNLTYQKNPSLFNVAPSGVQSSIYSSNSYPIKPQSQFPEQQVFEFGSQKKPSFSNSFGTFVTPKPTSYPSSTAYTSFSSPGYGNSGVSGSLDKSKPTSQFTSTIRYKPSFTNSFGGQSEVLKPSNQLTQTSSTFVSSNQPTNYKPFVTPSPLNTAKPNKEISVTDQKNSSIVNDYETVSSLSQQSSDTASKQPSIISTNYYTSPAPSISSELPSSDSNVEEHKDALGSAISNTSETDKKNNVTATVQTETNQPSNKPSQSSSFNLTYQKNPSLFNVAPSGVQSSIYSSNSYPIKPQSQFPEQQVFEFGSQKKPLFSNSFGTFVTPKPTSYTGSTAYTSFSSLGYGNSGVFESLDKSKPTSQFTSTIRYKPSFTNSFGGQSEVLKPSNQLTQTSSTFVSSNQPTNYKPFVSPSPLNTAKPNEEISVAGQKNYSTGNVNGTGPSLSQQSSYTASQQPSVVSTNYDTTPAPFISSTSKTDKNDYVTTAVQSETNQPINKPSQNSSFNLTYKKNPSLFNVASSGVQSSSLSLNSYPIKPQSQFLEQQVSELGSQKKPFFSNSFGTFVTPKPTSYPGSTAYTSFSSLGYGNSGVSGSLDKSKPTSQFTSTNQYKPSFTNNFGGQSGVLKPSNQPTQTSSAFISSNKPTNYKPFVTPSPLNTAKPNEEILVTDQKNSSIVKDFGTGSSLPQQSSSNKNSSTSFVILEPTHFVNTSGQSIASTTAGLIVSIGSESKFSENSEPTTSKTPSLSEGYDVSTKELDSGKTSDNIQSQFLTKPSVETAPQEKPLYTSNSYSGVTDVSSSTANFAQSTSFVNESKEKLKQTSSSISQNKPQFSGGFKEQKGVFHSKEPYPIGAVFVSSNTPLTSIPFVSPAPLNTSQQTITSQKESELNNYNLESVTGFLEPTKPPSYNGYQVNSSGVTPKPSDSGSFPSKTYTGTTSSSTAFTQQFPYKPLSGSSLDTSSVSTYSDKQKVEEKEKTGVYNTQKNNSVSLGEQKPTSQTFSSNSYFPTTGSAFISGSSQNKPQNQYPAKPIFQHTTQTQPWYLNTYQSFGAVKPFSYSYPGFSSSNFGHSSSIVTGAFDKTNKNSQFSSTWQYKPSYNWGKQKPSNQPTPYSPTTFKPFTSFDRSKLSSTSSVTSQKQPSLAGGFGSSFSISKPTNQQFIDESAYLTGNAKVSSTSPLTQTPNDFNYVSQTSNKPFSVSPLTGGYSYSPNVSPVVVSTTSKYEIQKPTSQTFSNAATSSLILEEQTSELSTQKPIVELVPSSEGFEKDYGNSKPTTQSFNYFNRPIDFRTPSIENKVITNSSDTSESMTTGATGSTASEVPKTSNLDYGAQENNDSKYLDASDKAILTSQREQSSYKPTYSTSVVSGFSNEQKVSPAVVSATETNHVYPDSTESAIYVPSKSPGQQFSGNSALFNIQQDAFHLSKPNIQNSVIGQPSSTTVQLPYAGGFGGPAGILKPNEFSAPINHINIPSQYNPSHYNQALTTPHREPNSASYSGGFGGSSGVLKPVQNEKYTSSGHVVNDNKYFSIAHNSRLQGTLTENAGHSNYNLVPNKSSTEAQSNFEERNLGSKATEEAQRGVVNQASVAAADATGEFINHSHNVQNLGIPLNNGASSGFGLEFPKNNKSFNDPISGLKISGLTPSTQGSTETGISSKAFGKSLAPGSATGQDSSGFTAKSGMLL